PGMLFGKVLRPPAFKAKLASVNTKEAEARPGVTVVRDGDFVGVVAPTEHAAAEALALVKAEWETTPQVSVKDLFAHLKKTARAGGGGFGGGRGGGGTQGSIDAGMKAADKSVKATYTVAYIAHAPLEPRAAVAEWADQVRVIVPDMGSGYGGKHTIDTPAEAARLAKAAGKPVKVVWTREEEFTWAYFRPAGVIEVTAGAKADGTLTAWEFHNYNSGGSAIGTPYTVPNRRVEFHAADSPLKQG